MFRFLKKDVWRIDCGNCGYLKEEEIDLTDDQFLSEIIKVFGGLKIRCPNCNKQIKTAFYKKYGQF